MLLVPACAVDPCAYCLTTYKRNIIYKKVRLTTQILEACLIFAKVSLWRFPHKNLQHKFWLLENVYSITPKIKTRNISRQLLGAFDITYKYE